MAKPPSTVRSIRLPNKTWEALTKLAETDGITVNALVGRMVDVGLSGIPILRNTAQKKSEPWTDASGRQHTFGGVGLHVDVPVGPTLAKPGSRLKGAKK